MIEELGKTTAANPGAATYILRLVPCRRPTEAGYYWWRYSGSEDFGTVLVKWRDGKLMASDARGFPTELESWVGDHWYKVWSCEAGPAILRTAAPAQYVPGYSDEAFCDEDD